MSHPAAPPIAELTLAGQAALGSGADLSSTKAVGPVPSVTLVDGPNGVRMPLSKTAALGAAARPATCFPPAVGLAQTWDPDAVARVGAAIGAEGLAQGVGVVLGPGINIKRDPRAGRNFEYYSEDPYLTGVLGSAWVSGVQSRGVGTSLKHFAAYNAEHDRMRQSSQVDPRTLREIYLRAFERVVRDACPWTIMSSYNRVNGVPVSQDPWLLTRVLREEWGFTGVVVSDWAAVTDRVAAVEAGLDLEMPGTGGRTDAQVVTAVRDGRLDPAVVARAAERVAALADRAAAARDADATVDVEAHHRLAREVAGRGVVLLKNSGGLLPLPPAGSLAVVGEFAQLPRYQGNGSGHVTPTRVDVPLAELRALAGPAEVSYSAGFTTDGTGDAEALRAEAVTAAAAADTAVVFLGLAASQESEGFDRSDIELPSEQLALLDAVLAAQPRTVIVLAHGGLVRLAPLDQTAPAILDAAMLGQAAGGAIADVLFGRVNPAGRLAETVPTRLPDVPAYLNFPGGNGEVVYGERLYVGYRWYDARELAVTYPFGHGLSYTTFAYSGLHVHADEHGLVARVTVANTGERAGREVVQLYVGLPGSSVERAPRELKGFDNVWLEAGESRAVEVAVRRADLAYWDVRVDRWVVEGGEYEIAVGASSRDLRACATVTVAGDALAVPLTLESTLAEVMAHPSTDPALADLLGQVYGGAGSGGDNGIGVDLLRFMASIPVGRLATASGDEAQDGQLRALIRTAIAPNGA